MLIVESPAVELTPRICSSAFPSWPLACTERPGTARDRSSRLAIAVLFNIAPDNTDILTGTAFRFSERFCAVTTISSRDPELFEDAGPVDVACAGSADAVAAKHVMIAVEHRSRLKLREPLVTDMPPILRRLSRNGSSFVARETIPKMPEPLRH